MANEKQQYSIEERITYWEERVLQIVHTLHHQSWNLIGYDQQVSNLVYAAKRLESLNMQRIKQYAKGERASDIA